MFVARQGGAQGGNAVGGLKDALGDAVDRVRADGRSNRPGTVPPLVGFSGEHPFEKHVETQRHGCCWKETTMNGIGHRVLTAALLGAVVVGGAACTRESTRTAGSATEGSDRAAIDREVTAAIADLYARNPETRVLGNNAEAMLVFPSVTTAGFGVGGSYGTGAMRQGGQTTAYYNLIAASFGYQLGAQTFSQAYFFNTPEALQTFKDTRGFEAGVGVTAVAADFGAGGDITSSTLQEPVVVVTWGQAGLMAGATVEGVKMTEINPD